MGGDSQQPGVDGPSLRDDRLLGDGTVGGGYRLQGEDDLRNNDPDGLLSGPTSGAQQGDMENHHQQVCWERFFQKKTIKVLLVESDDSTRQVVRSVPSFVTACMKIMSPTVVNTFNLRSILEKEKLNRTNFIDWYCNLRIILKQEKKEYVLEQPYPKELAEGASATDKRAYEKHTNDALNVSCFMLSTMNSELQKQYEDTDAFNMIVGLRGMFENQARAERYNISKSLYACRLAEGSPVSPHVIKMIGYIESL